MDYEPFKDLPGVTNMFMTGRGSTYALFDDQTSQRNRSGENHSDKTVGMQPRSYKTVFMDIDSLNKVGTAFRRDDWSTKLLPVLDENGKPTNKARLVLAEDYRYRPYLGMKDGKMQLGEYQTAKAGAVVAEVPYSTKPVKGMYPIEIYNNNSPKGDKGSGIHFGSKITEVLEKLDKKMQQGKAAVEKGAARGGGAYGGAMPSLENTTFQQYMKMNRGGLVEKQDPKAGNWKLI
jgi:hypothetical protein